MRIRQATMAHVEGLARLLWLDNPAEDPDPELVTAFTTDLSAWWAGHQDTHFGFIAQHVEHEIVGMAWVALLARTPRPGETCRISADIQTVYVEPQYRSRGIGSALVSAAAAHAEHAGAARVTVHSSRAAVAMYERLGFASTGQLLQRPRS